MEPRLNPFKAAPKAYQAMSALQAYTNSSGLEAPLMELVKMRASQINGCAYCLDMHSKDARAAGETEQRLYLLNAWHESPFYSDRERGALEWTEVLTKITEGHVPDEVYDRVKPHFSDEESRIYPSQLSPSTDGTVCALPSALNRATTSPKRRRPNQPSELHPAVFRRGETKGRRDEVAPIGYDKWVATSVALETPKPTLTNRRMLKWRFP